MKLSLNWLSKFIDLTDLSVDEIVEKMVKCGFEVEEVNKLSSGTNLVVGEVISCDKHPDSDHLHVCKVNIGNEVLDIVCGAPNCRTGLKVIVAKVGAVLPDGVIKESTIRGVASNGMLCSLKELGVDEHLLPADSTSINGIEELDASFIAGQEDILKKLGYDDTILDVSIYANRPDCMSMFAMAKEMGAILDKEVKLPDYKGASNIGTKSNFKLTSTSVNCPHFLAKVINKVTIKQSPDWLKEILRANGVKCINNLVDISNLVMLETGQPLHFYELRSNPNRNIKVVDDYQGEYKALDGITYNICKGDLMITSDDLPIGIAGIMGGDNTKILDDTSGLIIEAASFDHAAIRNTANRLGLQTEAAMRFAKGLEPMSQNKAMDRAVQLLIELADASQIEETVEYGKALYEPYKIVESLSHLNKLIGKEYRQEEVEKVLKRLDFKYEIKDEDFIISIPDYRAMDLKIKEDIDEEIVRLSGFDDLNSTLPIMEQTIGTLSNIQKIRKTIKNTLVANGLNEVCNYTLVSKDDIDNGLFIESKPAFVLSPLSDERKYVRNSLLPSLLHTLSYNIAHYNNDVNIFELSKVYDSNSEQERLGVLLYGNLNSNPLIHNTINNNFYIIKGLALEVLKSLGYSTRRITIKENDLDIKHFHPYNSALILINNEVIGLLGQLNPNYLAQYKLNNVYYLELKVDVIEKLIPEKTKAISIPKYPSISRDISLLVNRDVKASDLINCIKKSGGKLVNNVKVFDLYQGNNIALDSKSISLNIVYLDPSKTLTSEEVNLIHTNIINQLIKQFNALIR